MSALATRTSEAARNHRHASVRLSAAAAAAAALPACEREVARDGYDRQCTRVRVSDAVARGEHEHARKRLDYRVAVCAADGVGERERVGDVGALGDLANALHRRRPLRASR